jgi:hypothetical protein
MTTASYWDRLMRAATVAIRQPVQLGPLLFHVEQDGRLPDKENLVLYIDLPSGRQLVYPQFRNYEGTMSYWNWNKKARSRFDKHTVTENVTSSIARGFNPHEIIKRDSPTPGDT